MGFPPRHCPRSLPRVAWASRSGELQRQNARRLAEREVGRLLAEKTRLENLTESEVQASQVLRSKQAAMERMNELLAAAYHRLNDLS